jgi:hypothetical protein
VSTAVSSDLRTHVPSPSARVGPAAAGAAVAIGVAAVLVPLRDTAFGNSNVALVLVLVVVGAAMLGGRLAGVTTAVVAALAFNFFHTQPYLTLSIEKTEDIATFFLLLVVGLIVGELSQLQRRSRHRESEQAAGARLLEDVAATLAAGVPTEEVWTEVRDGLVVELGLRSCRFEPAPFSPRLPAVDRRGRIEGQELRWTLTGFELPDGGAQLTVEHAGSLLGRLVLEPTPGHGTTLDQRRVAVALADQLAVVLAQRRPLAPMR